GRRCLEVLGLPLPARIKRSHLIGPLLRITMLHRRLAVKSEAPPIAQLDAQTAAILSCLADMWGPAFWLDENLTGLVVLTLVRLSLSRGNVGASAIGYASYGVFLSTVRKRHRAGQEVCRLGVRVAESAGDPVYTARARFMYASFFGPRDEPVRNALTTFRELVNGCLQCGEYPYAGAAANMFLYYLPVVGLPLLEVESGIREMLGVARHTEQNRVIATVEILRRWIATLEGRAELAEPSFSFDLSGTAGRRNENERGLFHLFEISLLYLLEDYEGAMRHIDVLPGNQMLNGYFGVYYAFFAALVLAKRGARQQPRGAWWRAFRRHRRLVSGEATPTPRACSRPPLRMRARTGSCRTRPSLPSWQASTPTDRARRRPPNAIFARRGSGFTSGAPWSRQRPSIGVWTTAPASASRRPARSCARRAGPATRRSCWRRRVSSPARRIRPAWCNVS